MRREIKHLADLGVSREAAVSITMRLKALTLAARSRRQYEQQVNATYLRSLDAPHETNVAAHEVTSFQGGDAEIATFMRTVAQVAQARFADKQPREHYDKKHDIAFDIGHSDQFGDWALPADLDKLVQLAIDENLLEQLEGVSGVSVERHDRDHDGTRYAFGQTGESEHGWSSCTVIRKRPIADVTFSVDDASPVTIEIFRHSMFLMNVSDDNTDLSQAVRMAADASSRPVDKRSDVEQQRLLEMVQLLKDILADESARGAQTLVIPCSMGYIARVREPDVPVSNMIPANALDAVN